MLVALLLQVAVIYLPFLQRPFATAPLGLSDWAVCLAVASSVLWLRELVKLIARPSPGGGAAARGPAAAPPR